MEFNTKKTALLVIDMQNDNMSPGGKSEKTGAVEHAAKQQVTSHIRQLMDMAHILGIPVFHNYFIVEKGAKGIGRNAPIFSGIAEIESVVRGTWGAAPVSGVEPAEGDFVLERTRMSAFNGTQLDTLLRGLGVDTIIVTGVWTNMAVEHTCRDGADQGYKVVVATDGTATINDEWQHAAMDYAMNNIAEKMSTSEILSKLKK